MSKRYKAIAAKVDRNKLYPLNDALKLVKETAVAKFDESIDIAINLGIDAKKSDQLVRGSVVLPKGTGKTVRVAVFAQGAKAEEAKAAGADIVGFEDLAESIKGGNLNFDVLIASPDAMRLVGQLGQILGPRGLMPNPKVGTVSADVAGAVKNAKAGQVQYRTDKNGIVQCTIGRASFAPEALRENLLALIDALNKAKPAASKGIYLKKVSLSSTMGAGIRVEQAVWPLGCEFAGEFSPAKILRSGVICGIRDRRCRGRSCGLRLGVGCPAYRISSARRWCTTSRNGCSPDSRSLL
jgi:large subunit ribosomal protein L1